MGPAEAKLAEEDKVSPPEGREEVDKGDDSDQKVGGEHKPCDDKDAGSEVGDLGSRFDDQR